MVFIVGAPRSGTTWLNSMVTAHPDVVGANESHLFDDGVDRLFDNFERIDWERQFLRNYLSRPELVDLVRDLCDGILVKMRARRGPSATLIVEKTPFATAPAVELRRKLDCYPDAWYIHLIRDPRGVARSSSRRWASSPEQTALMWSQSMRAVRDHLTGHPRLRELRYEDLVEDPLPIMRDLFQWLGLRADHATDALVRKAAGRQIEPREGAPAVNVTSWQRDLSPATVSVIERVAGDDLAALGYELTRPTVPLVSRLALTTRSSLRSVPLVRRAVSIARDVLGRGDVEPPDAMLRPPDERLALVVHDVAAAFAATDRRALCALVDTKLEVELRVDGSTRSAVGEDAVDRLIDCSRQLFSEPFRSSAWVAAPVPPVSMAWFRGETETGHPVEFALALHMEDYRPVRIALLGYGAG